MARGKAYANKRAKNQRPKGDLYNTPKSLIWVAQNIILENFAKENILLEPCCGNKSVSEELTKLGYSVIINDLYAQAGIDYLKLSSLQQYKYIITNPPFSLWDEFVKTAKTHCTKFMFIGRLNYLGTNSRTQDNLWKNLKAIYAFNRYVDYQTPYRQDGHFCVGAMATGWFLWDMAYIDKPTIEILNVQQYATLGGFYDYQTKGV